MQTDADRQPVDQRELRSAIVQLNTRILAFSIAVVFGLGLFIVTNWLVLKGGPNVGAHLILLRQYFPGYSVTFVGSLIGFLYAFAIGYVVGLLIGQLYNRLAHE